MALPRLDVVKAHLAQPSISLVNCSLTVRESRPDGLVYTVENSCLSPEQRMFYETNGYIVIPDLVDPEIIDACSSRFSDLCEGRVEKGFVLLMKDISLKKKGAKGEYLYNKAQDLLFDDVFERYFFCPKLLDVVESFTGPNIMGLHSMLINKPPDSGELTSRHPLHQDLLYFPVRPPNKIVAAWTALQDITPDNGCLVVIPGTHKGPLLEHGYPEWEGGVNKAFYGIKNCNYDDLIPLPMKKGETVFFHPLLIHGSGPNRTKGFRKAITGHFTSTECHFIDVKGTLQEDAANEIVAIARQRGLELCYNDLWRAKMRLVRGENKNLI